METLINVFHAHSGKEGDKYKLSKKELKELLQTELSGFLDAQKDADAVDKVMKELDENGDGEVDFQEYVVLVAALTVACNNFFWENNSRDLKMAAQSAPKVVLKSTTKMSLNERFTNMLKNKQPMPVNIRASMQQQQQLASARNRRLAQQMENRPSVQAALKLKQKSLKQRLGKSNIQARLGRPIGTLARGAIGGRGLPIIQRGLPRGGLRGGRATRTLLRGGMSLRGQNLLRGGRAVAPRMGLRRGGVRGRGGPGRGGLGRGAMGRGGIGGRGRGMIGRGRGGFGGRGRGRGRGRGALARPVLTKEQLDNQLDAYMSKTKGHLDAELDAYMAQTDPETND
ncbi:hypothetical protein MJG53_001389 [Ovis ammon polii x Ovis aries]|uniref:Protein S100-A1 n=5 Tax=Boreoeutheria TaxID=1437010 RepID=A0A836D6Z4_SHEEP|nr:hypothetical protein JEQ12_000907 [Ovis aries]KAI4590340.1 hypothetical protein MJG53_001389 [Ovis ammon polii x Ovis aries]